MALLGLELSSIQLTDILYYETYILQADYKHYIFFTLQYPIDDELESTAKDQRDKMFPKVKHTKKSYYYTLYIA